MQITATSAVQPVQPIADAPPQATPQSTPPSTPQVVATSPVPPVRLLNPQPVIDPALGIVVTEYFNRTGTLTSQYPTERVLDNYRIYGEGDAQSQAIAPRPADRP